MSYIVWSEITPRRLPKISTRVSVMIKASWYICVGKLDHHLFRKWRHLASLCHNELTSVFGTRILSAVVFARIWVRKFHSHEYSCVIGLGALIHMYLGISICPWTGSLLVQVMVCSLVGAIPLPAKMRMLTTNLGGMMLQIIKVSLQMYWKMHSTNY